VYVHQGTTSEDIRRRPRNRAFCTAIRANLRVGRPEAIVDFQSRFVVFDARRIEVHSLDIRRSADGDENPIDEFAVVLFGGRQTDAIPDPLGAKLLSAVADEDAVANESLPHEVRRIAIVVGQDSS
jgi:hypothetical protein